MTALRHSMLSSGATLGLIEVYQSLAANGLSARDFRAGSPSTLLSEAGCTPVPAISTCRSPEMIRLSMSSALAPIVTSYRSGRAFRFGSVAGSQLGLRLSVKALPPSYVSNMYGPDETGCSLYFVPVSLVAGTGAVDGSIVK